MRRTLAWLFISLWILPSVFHMDVILGLHFSVFKGKASGRGWMSIWKEKEKLNLASLFWEEIITKIYILNDK